MICGKCGQDESKCERCSQTSCPNWFRDGSNLRPCTRKRGHTKKCKFEIKEVDVSEKRNHTLLQGLLRSGVKVSEVIDKYKLNVNRSKRHPNLVQFKYDQIESDLSDALVQQCRGIILDETDNWEIVARPFDKFFNYGEHLAAKIDWETARVVEKLDGTCCILYYYDGWHVATLGSADASGDVHNFAGMTFKDLFWNAFQAKGYKVPDAWRGVTFIFELTSPYNRVVVQHAYIDLKLLGARVADGSESSIKGDIGFQVAKTFDLKSFDDVIKTFDKMDPLMQEGYVIVDGKFNRIKVKHPGYVRIHHIKESFTLRNVMEIIRKGESLEFLTYFPEHEPFIKMLQESYDDLAGRITQDWVRFRGITDQKNFALAVQGAKLPYESALFALKNGHATVVREVLQRIHIDRLISWMEVKEAAKSAA